MIIQMLEIIFIVALLSCGVYFSRPRVSKTDKFFTKLQKEMKKKTPVFDYKITGMLDSELGHVKNILDFNKINYSFSHKNQDQIISVMTLSHKTLDVNYYGRQHLDKPRRIKKVFRESSNVIPVDFKSRKRV